MANTQKATRKSIRKLNPVRLAIVVGVFVGLILIGSVTGLVLYSIKDMPAWNPAVLQPNLPSNIYDKDKNEITSIYVENRVPIQFNQIPDKVLNAFLSIEDIRFYEHKGLDLRRIIGAFLADIKAGKAAQGASTITQQLVKRAFLTPEKTMERKIQEAVLAIQIERRFTKNQIFEMYLNQIYFGEGAYGIQSASQVYFGKDVKDLNLEEAAMLAGLPKAPNNYDPFKDMEAARKRRNIVLESMVRYEFITRAEADAAEAKTVTLTGTKAKQYDTYKFPYFVDYITDTLIAKYGEDKVYKGGLKVYTTLDPKIQTYAEQAMANPKNFPQSKTDDKGVIQPQAAVVVLDPHTGYIKAVVGGRDHKQKRQFNRATDALRQPGSAFKPVAVYGPAVEKGQSPTDVVDDTLTKFGSYTYKNYDGKYRGLITYREAVAYSVNVAAVKVMEETGILKSLNFAKKLGISSLVMSETNPKHNDENLSSALGGLTWGVKPLELAAAYGAFDNDGVYIQPTAIIKVEDRDGNIIDQVTPKKTIAMKKTTAYLITSMMESAVDYGTATSASLGSRPVAGKTGTTSDDKDAWFAGYTPELVCVVWMGHDDPKHMNKVYGGSYPAKIWRYIMSKSLSGVPVKEFQKPDGIVWATVCSKSGKLSGDTCPKEDLVSDVFAKGTVPSMHCEGHTPVEVCAESSQLPTDKCPQRVTMFFLNGKEPTDTCKTHVGQPLPPPKPGTPVCNDPLHGGILYLALIPGPTEQGGCPPEVVQNKVFSEGQAPTAYCDIPEHQLTPKPPEDTGSPGTQDTPNTTTPVNSPGPDKPNKPNKP